MVSAVQPGESQFFMLNASIKDLLRMGSNLVIRKFFLLYKGGIRTCNIYIDQLERICPGLVRDCIRCTADMNMGIYLFV
jgi:hypothetical protein